MKRPARSAAPERARPRHRLKSWRAYDPTWLVKLARKQLHRQPGIARALKACTRERTESVAYLFFVDPRNANKPGAAWQFSRNEYLFHPEYGQLILDVLKDARIGGLEFLVKTKERARWQTARMDH